MGVDHDKIMDRYERQLEFIAQRSCFLSANRIPRETRKFSGQSRANTRMSIGSPNTRVTLAATYRRNAITGELSERELSLIHI